jgi:AraC family L-rhamnose operon transcriptional activator RhaR
MGDQQHDFLELFYVLEGAGTFHIAGRPWPCRGRDLVAVPPGIRHRIEDNPAGPLALYGIAVAPSVWRGEPGLLDRLPAGRQLIGAPLAGKVRADLKRLLFEQTHARPGSRTLILGLTLQLLAEVVRAAGDAATVVLARANGADCRRIVERYVAELPHRFLEATDLDDAAAELGMSRRRLTHLFRQVTGTSWAVYLTRLRIAYACRLLQESSRSILSTAFECGYEDPSNFCRVFRRQTGMTPRAWRERSQPASASSRFDDP